MNLALDKVVNYIKGKNTRFDYERMRFDLLDLIEPYSNSKYTNPTSYMRSMDLKIKRKRKKVEKDSYEYYYLKLIDIYKLRNR